MATPISSSIAYASPADMIARVDQRQLFDFTQDDGTRCPDADTFSASPKVSAALLDASGMVDMYALKGNKYSAEDLQSLQGTGRAILVKLVVELAYWNLSGRRFQKKEMPPETLWAFSVLDDLARGAKIFPLADQANAGNPQDGFMTQNQWATLAPAMFQSQRLWGRRAYQNVPGGSANGQGNGQGCCDGD